MTDEAKPIFPKPGEIGLTWISGWTGFWVTMGQWLAGDGGLWPFRRPKKNLERGYPTHAFLVLEDGKIIEAEPGGVKYTTVHNLVSKGVMEWAVPGVPRFADGVLDISIPD